MEIKFIDKGNDGGLLYLRNGVEQDALKKYHITGAKKISVVNDYHLGDAFSKAMYRKGEMNKYRGRYEFPCKPEVHDIGKNIVKVILESYGFKVIDLGKNVPAEEVLRVASGSDRQ